MTKEATGSYISAFLSISETKLSGIRHCSTISRTVVIKSSCFSWNSRHSNRVCHASSLPLLSQLVHSGLSASYMWNRYVWNALWPDITWVRQKFICPWPLSNYVSKSWLAYRFTILPSYQRAIPSIYKVWLAFHHTWFAVLSTLRANPTCGAVYPLALIHNHLKWGISASTQTNSVETVQYALIHLNTAFRWTKTISVLRYSHKCVSNNVIQN